jgi:hypothetical protein
MVHQAAGRVPARHESSSQFVGEQEVCEQADMKIVSRHEIQGDDGLAVL